MNTLRQFIGRVRLQLRGKNHVVGWNMTPQEVVDFFKDMGKTVLTFCGYSGIRYEDEQAMLQIARKILAEYSPETTLINIGVTSVGIGAVYPLAKSMRFATAGIVTHLALLKPDGISESVDHVCFVTDTQWGGKLPGSQDLSPTSKAMVACSDVLVGIGSGGGIGGDELRAGKALGKPVQFFPAEMNHEVAIRYAKSRGLPPPESFWGSDLDAFNE